MAYIKEEKSGLLLPSSLIDELNQSRDSAVKITELSKALDSAKGKLNEYFYALQELQKSRAKGAKVDAELLSISRMTAIVRNSFDAAGNDLLREIFRLCPLVRLAMQKRIDQFSKLCQWSDNGSRLGYRIIHSDHYREGADSSKVESGADFRKSARRLDILLNNPSIDDRIGSTFIDFISQLQENYYISDNIAIVFTYENPKGNNRRLGDIPNSGNLINGFVVLDGLSVEPIMSTIYDLVNKERAGKSKETDYSYVEYGREILFQYFSDIMSDKSELEKYSWVQRDLDGRPINLFRSDEIVVCQRHKTTAIDARGWGFSPIQQALFLIQNWFSQIFYHIKLTRPGINHLRNILYITGKASTEQAALSVARQLEEDVAGQENWGVVPILGLPGSETDLRKIDLMDPKYLQSINESLTIWHSMASVLLGFDPADFGLPSASRTSEGGGLTSNAKSYEQALARSEGFYGVCSYFGSIINKLFYRLTGTTIYKFEWTGINETDDEATRIQNQTNKKFSTWAEDRVAFGLPEIDKKYRVYTIGGREIDPTQWQKGLEQYHWQLINVEAQDKQQQQQFEEQASQQAGMIGQGGEGLQDYDSEEVGGYQPEGDEEPQSQQEPDQEQFTPTQKALRIQSKNPKIVLTVRRA